MTVAENTLDNILVQIGSFGKYQIFVFSLVCLGIVFHSAVHVAYVFTAMDLSYRCEIPECDSRDSGFEPPWLHSAVPYSKDAPSKCLKFFGNATTDTNCTEYNHFAAQTETCDSFVYKTDENSILREYDLQCDDNLWKLTLVGTINNVGQFFGLFISGIVSDRFGRKIVFILGMAICGVWGLLKSVAPSYEWFLVFEFLDAAFGAGSYVCGFIMGVELVGPKHRVMTGTLVSSSYAIGEMFASVSAWLTHDWKRTLYILYTPPLCLLSYFWLIPESMRWYLSKGKTEDAKKILKRVAQVNGKQVDEAVFEKVALEETETPGVFWDLIKTSTLMLRLVNCCFCWITCAFLFYGLTLNSIALNGNSYLDFILSALVEIPGYFICIWLLDRIGRRWSMSGSFFLTGISCLVLLFVEDDDAILAVNLIGKFGATIAFTVTYVVTSELFPTPVRHSTMGTCSTFGRIGSMVAPQTPLLVQIWNPLPYVLFTSMATVAGLLTLLFPETVNTNLPDTIEEAVRIGKDKKADKQ